MRKLRFFIGALAVMTMLAGSANAGEVRVNRKFYGQGGIASSLKNAYQFLRLDFGLLYVSSESGKNKGRGILRLQSMRITRLKLLK